VGWDFNGVDVARRSGGYRVQYPLVNTNIDTQWHLLLLGCVGIRRTVHRSSCRLNSGSANSSISIGRIKA